MQSTKGLRWHGVCSSRGNGAAYIQGVLTYEVGGGTRGLGHVKIITKKRGEGRNTVKKNRNQNKERGTFLNCGGGKQTGKTWGP